MSNIQTTESTIILAREDKMWAIADFPVDLRNRFAGKAKEKGLRIPELLEIVITKYLEDEKNGRV